EEWILACLGSYNDENLTRWYPWGQANPDSIQANLLNTDIIGSPTYVGSYPGYSNVTGLYDMAGNVAEWTITNFAQRQPANTEDVGEFDNPDVSPVETNMDSTATGFQQTDANTEEDLDTSIRFVVKGGSYLDPPSNTQLNRRITRFPHERYQYVGFRCVRREGTR
ncbi:MAG TPA: hypothetical protein ENH10_04925, partial [Bacteroidetes bacterium]|nr:hypothetical protein [Bacteroidota bacterium]HEX04485.1 hypothetical protein [Bacteroidota bacterium]